MTFLDVALPMGGSLQSSWMRTCGYKAPLILISVLLLVVVWISPPPSFLSYSQLSASQIQTFFGTQVTHLDYTPSNSSSESSPASNDVADHESSPAAVQQQPESPTNDEKVSSEDSEVSEKERPGSVETEQVPHPESGSPNENVTGVDSKSEPSANPTNVTAEAALNPDVEDSQLAVEEAAIQGEPQAEEVKYIMPLLSGQVGTGNQLFEYKSAAIVARTLNRTLCLTPFWNGPGRHMGYLGDRHSGLFMEERYDVEVLAKMVKVASMDECVEKCEHRLDRFWRLRPSRPPRWDKWFNDTPRVSLDFGRASSKWTKTADVAAALGPLNDGKCLGLGGLFPGLRWRGVLFAGSAYMQHSKIIMKATDLFQARALGSTDNNYVAVHWRFEESNCRGHPLGLCFSRCKDGAVIANGRRSETWENMTREGRKTNSKDGFNGVFVSQSDVSGAISERAEKLGVRNVYLSTDGWLRGPESGAILKWVVEDLRSKGFNVAGLWQMNLPNFADGSYVHPDTMAELFGLKRDAEPVSNHMIALVEQEICVRAAVFLGSGQSSWSLAVSDTRQGRKCKHNIEEQIKEVNPNVAPAELDREVIDRILEIQYTPGPTCRGSHNGTNIPPEEESPDGWLDYESCEERLLEGTGECRRITT